MARPRPEMRDQILSAATQLFAVQGYASTSLQAVADAVGVRKQSLLYYFPNKDALRKAVLEAVLSYWKEVVPKALVQATSGEGRFESVIKVVLDFFKADRSRAQVIIRESLDRPLEMKERLRNHFRPWMGLLNYIRKGQRQGLVYQDVDPESYVIQSATLALYSVAMADIGQAIYPDSPTKKQAAERMIAEAQRLTKAGLFTDHGLGLSRPCEAIGDSQTED